jgi:hypothetical protein
VPVDARRLIPPNYKIITRKMCHRGPSAGLSSDFHTAWAHCCPLPRGSVSGAGESGHSIRSPTAGHPPKLAVAGCPVALPPGVRSTQRGCACCRQLGLRPPGRALVGTSWRGLGRRPAMGGVGLEIACCPVCRSRRWRPTGRFFRATVLLADQSAPAKGDIRAGRHLRAVLSSHDPWSRAY